MRIGAAIARVLGVTAKHNSRGEECPDPTPIEIPLGMKVPETLEQKIARMVHAQNFRDRMEAQGFETVDESNDFDIPGDDPEDQFSQHETMARAIAEEEDVKAGREAAKRIAQRRAARRDRDEERGRRGVRGEEDADREREHRGRVSRGREPDREGSQSREDENAGERGRSRGVAEDR